MNNISNEFRAHLKRLCPYVGSYIPNSVRERARHFWPAPYNLDKLLAGSGMTAADSINANWNCARWMLIASTRQDMSRFVPSDRINSL